MIRVVLADDQELVRAGLRALLERADDLTVVGEAADGTQAWQVVRDRKPDVVLMDIRMPGMDGMEAARRVLAEEALRQVKVVMLTTYDTDEHVFEALRLGVAGFLRKDTTPDELRRAVRVVAAGDALLSPAVTRRVMAAATAAHARSPERVAHLTERERLVLAKVAVGRSNQELAAELYISPATARTYVSRLLTKLDARDRAQLVVIAYQSGLVRPDGSGPAG